MRADNYDEQERRRAAQERQSERASARDTAAVLTPGMPSPAVAETQPADVARAAELAQLERQISEKRFHARQLYLCAEDPTVIGGEIYAAQHRAAEAEVQQLEARADALRKPAHG